MDSDWIREPYAEEQHDVEGANPQPQPDAAVIEPTQEAAAAEAASQQLDAPLTASPEVAAPPAAEGVDDDWAEQSGRRPISAFEKVATAHWKGPDHQQCACHEDARHRVLLDATSPLLRT
jgi:hypothetical protein